MKLSASKLLSGFQRLIEVEQNVGVLWHRIMSRVTRKHYPEAAVYLDDMQRIVGVMFRALGGDGALKIESTTAVDYKMTQGLRQRIAGNNIKFELACRNESSLFLPACIAVFPEKSLNHDLYIWLAVLASGETNSNMDEKNNICDWIKRNQYLTCRALKRLPGLSKLYQRLVSAQLALWSDLNQIIQAILQNPEIATPILKQNCVISQPVYLWLYPMLPQSDSGIRTEQDINSHKTTGETFEPKQQRRYRAQHVAMPETNKGLVLDRFENIFTLAEYLKIDRNIDEDDDLASAEDAANDLEQLSIARDNKASAKRIRFDLDLPSSDCDDSVLGEGILLPEWDYRKHIMRKDYCCLQPMIADSAAAIELPVKLHSTARQLRHQFEALKPERLWYRAQLQGSEIDLDAYLDFVTSQKQKTQTMNTEQGLYREFRGGLRDMACLLLADLSLSTDSWVNDESRVIDVIRDSLFLFSEALSASADQFALYGFSSRNRQHIRFHTLKTFTESYNAVSRGRINSIKPGFYTRMGAAIRHASEILNTQDATQQLLLILTDGKPNDLDQYDGRYGIEDTRMALIEARRKGMQAFCVTIDDKAGDYLPHMFGIDNYVVIRKPSELPQELPLLYARLTHHS
ncbi:MAG: nitric oxide reductase activation protein NorD [Gammaproteobacteria bacterium]